MAFGKIVVALIDPVIERIEAYPWAHGGVSVRKIRGGYSLSSARTGASGARLKPIPQDDLLRSAVVAPQCLGLGRAVRRRPLTRGRSQLYRLGATLLDPRLISQARN